MVAPKSPRGQALGVECADDPGQLADLRDWAWSRGRTDVVGHLDLHEQAWAFQRCPCRDNLVSLAAVVPAGRLGGPLEADLRRFVAAGGTEHELGRLRCALEAWTSSLCMAVRADIEAL